MPQSESRMNEDDDIEALRAAAIQSMGKKPDRDSDHSHQEPSAPGLLPTPSGYVPLINGHHKQNMYQQQAYPRQNVHNQQMYNQRPFYNHQHAFESHHRPSQNRASHPQHFGFRPFNSSYSIHLPFELKRPNLVVCGQPASMQGANEQYNNHYFPETHLNQYQPVQQGHSNPQHNSRLLMPPEDENTNRSLSPSSQDRRLPERFSRIDKSDSESEEDDRMDEFLEEVDKKDGVSSPSLADTSSQPLDESLDATNETNEDDLLNYGTDEEDNELLRDDDSSTEDFKLDGHKIKESTRKELKMMFKPSPSHHSKTDNAASDTNCSTNGSTEHKSVSQKSISNKNGKTSSLAPVSPVKKMLPNDTGTDDLSDTYQEMEKSPDATFVKKIAIVVDRSQEEDPIQLEPKTRKILLKSGVPKEDLLEKRRKKFGSLPDDEKEAGDKSRRIRSNVTHDDDKRGTRRRRIASSESDDLEPVDRSKKLRSCVVIKK